MSIFNWTKIYNWIKIYSRKHNTYKIKTKKPEYGIFDTGTDVTLLRIRNLEGRYT